MLCRSLRAASTPRPWQLPSCGTLSEPNFLRTAPRRFGPASLDSVCSYESLCLLGQALSTKNCALSKPKLAQHAQRWYVEIRRTEGVGFEPTDRGQPVA